MSGYCQEVKVYLTAQVIVWIIPWEGWNCLKIDRFNLFEELVTVSLEASQTFSMPLLDWTAYWFVAILFFFLFESLFMGIFLSLHSLSWMEISQKCIFLSIGTQSDQQLAPSEEEKNEGRGEKEKKKTPAICLHLWLPINK